MVGIKSTLAGAVVSVCATEQTPGLNQAAFAALTWVAIGNVGNLGDYGASPNIVNYNTLDTDVVQKSKGVTDAGDLSIEVARIFDDAGQIIMRAAGLTKFNYAIKIEYDDAPTSAYTNTIVYNCGVVTGPQTLGGGTDVLIRESYTVGFNQRQVTVNPALI